MTALGLPYPTIVGTVAGGEWASTVMDRVVADGRYGVRLGPDARGGGRRAAGVHRGGLCRRPVPARPSRHGRDHRAPGSRPRRCRPDHRLVDGPVRGVPRRATGRTPRADRRARTARTCGCSSTSATTPCVMFGPGDVRLAHGGRRVGARWTRSRRAPACWRPGSPRRSAPADRSWPTVPAERSYEATMSIPPATSAARTAARRWARRARTGITTMPAPRMPRAV